MYLPSNSLSSGPMRFYRCRIDSVMTSKGSSNGCLSLSLSRRKEIRHFIRFASSSFLTRFPAICPRACDAIYTRRLSCSHPHPNSISLDLASISLSCTHLFTLLRGSRIHVPITLSPPVHHRLQTRPSHPQLVSFFV